MLPKTQKELQYTVDKQLEKIVRLERNIKDHRFSGGKLTEALAGRREVIRELEARLEYLHHRVLDEQSAFDKMEELYLQGQESFRVLEKQLVSQGVTLAKYGGHTKQCVRYYHKVNPCDCGWDKVEEPWSGCKWRADEVVYPVPEDHPGHGHTETLPVPEDPPHPPELPWFGRYVSYKGVEGHEPECEIDLYVNWAPCTCEVG